MPGIYQNWHCDGGSAVARERRLAMFVCQELIPEFKLCTG